jgi:hypothetical protein
MITTFGPRVTGGARGPLNDVFSPELRMLFMHSNDPVDRLDVISYVKRTGNLDWLQPLDEHWEERMRRDGSRWNACEAAAASLEEMAAFEDVCKRLGLTLPKCFRQFMVSVQLQRRISAGYQWTLEPLVKLKSADNELLDGYVCKFYADPVANGE